MILTERATEVTLWKRVRILSIDVLAKGLSGSFGIHAQSIDVPRMSPKLGPIKRKDFIKKLKSLGFTGPEPGTRHEYMTYNDFDLRIPSYDEYSVPLHKQMKSEVETIVARQFKLDEWAKL